VYTYTQKINKLIDLYMASNDMSVKVGVSLVSCSCASQGIPASV